MPIPLVWIGAGIIAAAAGNKLSQRYQKHLGEVGFFPGEAQTSVKPVAGAIVCCGVFEVFEHSGIWTQDAVIELNGNGLVRQISPDRFIRDRSGESIFIACDQDARPLVGESILLSAQSQLYEYLDYHVLTSNCHNFVWKSLSLSEGKVTRFAELNERMSQFFNTSICWHPLDY
jgi:hypothetical protein